MNACRGGQQAPAQRALPMTETLPHPPATQRHAPEAAAPPPTCSIGTLQVELHTVVLSQVDGLDPAVADVLAKNMAHLSVPINLDAWRPETLRWIYLRSPLVLAPARKAARYRILGSGLPGEIARRAWGPAVPVPAWVVTAPRRIDAACKLDILAAELLGLRALYGSRKTSVASLDELRQAIEQAGGHPFVGTGVSVFAKAMGCSLGSIAVRKPPSKAQDPSGSSDAAAP
jgi:hypothetical protein